MLHRFVSCLAAGMAVTTLGFSLSVQATTLTRLETFPSDALDQFVEVGDTHAGGSDFGFSATNNVGLGAGEAGGTMARSHTIRAYADIDLGGTLQRNENLHVSGSFRLANIDFNGELMIGFFNTFDLDSAGGLPFIGLGIWEPGNFFPPFDPTGTMFRGFAHVFETGHSVDGFPAAASESLLLEPNVTHAFSLDWIANPNGSGTLSGVIAGVPVSATLSTTVMDTFNAFGVGVGLNFDSNDTQRAQFFADNLVYSIIPEPSSAGSLMIGVATLLVRDRRKNRKSTA
jgi:hypothetical protein